MFTPGKLDFDQTIAQRLMKIARDPWLSNPAHAPLLPKHWTTLFELTKLSDEEREQALEEGSISKDMQRADVNKIRGQKPKVTDAEYDDITDPERAAVSDPKPKPPEAHGNAQASDGAGSFGETDARQSAPAAAQPGPARQETPENQVHAGGAGGSPAAHHDGWIAFWVDPDDPVSWFANGLTMAIQAYGVLSPKEFARSWPVVMPLRCEELHKFCGWLLDFEAEYGAQYAALQAAE
jgi:hypothetical protein